MCLAIELRKTHGASEQALVHLQWPVTHPFGQTKSKITQSASSKSRTSIGTSAFMDLGSRATGVLACARVSPWRAAARRSMSVQALRSTCGSGVAAGFSGAGVRRSSAEREQTGAPSMIIKDSRGPNSPRSQCRDFLFVGAAVAKEAAILSTSKIDATSLRWTGKQAASTTPSRRSSFSDRSAPTIPVSDRSRGKYNWSFGVFEYRPGLRMCEVKDEDQLRVQ